MSRFIVRIAAAACLLVFLYGRQSSATFWNIASVVNLPDNPRDPYYNKFQTVPTTEFTATKFMTNFLGISSTNRSERNTPPPTDIVMVIDGSQSIGSCEFKRGKIALNNSMQASHLKNHDVKYAAVTFSWSARVNFKFLTYSQAKRNGELTKISYPDSWTNTQAGLAKAKELFEDPNAGQRRDSKKVVLLVTDGQSNRETKKTIPNAKKLKDMGVSIFVVAVGEYIDGIGEMVKVAGTKNPSAPPDDFLFRVRDYDGFLKVTKLVVNEVPKGVPLSSNC